jgi:hypothetical protein
MMLSMLAAIIAQVSTAEQDFAEAVRTTAAQATIEAVANRPGHVTVRDVRLLDMDHDGQPEALVWIEPHLRQTPYILVYSRDSSGAPRLLLEGLAPGRLQPISGRLIDDHTLGLGVDLTVGAPGQPVDVDRLLSAAKGTGMTLIRYRSFFHTDKRRGYVGFIDLSDRPLPDTSRTCEGFEFSRIDGMAVGTLAGHSGGQVLAVLTTDDITVYEFQGIRPNGTLVTHTSVRERESHVTGVGVSPAGQLYLLTNTTRIPLQAP